MLPCCPCIYIYIYIYVCVCVCVNNNLHAIIYTINHYNHIYICVCVFALFCTSLSPWPSPGVQLSEFIMYCMYVYSWFWLLINPLHLGRRANSWPIRSSFRNEATNQLANRAWWKRHCAAAPGCRAAVPWQITTWGVRARATSEAQLATARCPGFINCVKQEVKWQIPSAYGHHLPIISYPIMGWNMPILFARVL